MIARRDSGSTLLRIEDTTSAVVYSGTWTSSKRTDPDYNDDDDHEMSLHTSTTVGSTVKFAFNGASSIFPTAHRPTLVLLEQG